MSVVWSKIIPPTGGSCQDTLRAYATQMKAPLWVADLLSQRDCTSLDEARVFFQPQDRGIHNSSEMCQLPELVQQLVELDKKTQIVVHGDYDVDGITGTALMYLGLRKAGFEKVRTFLPSRFHEGYGLTPSTVETFQQEGVEWIITVDTGITAVDEIAHARSLGMKVAVVDHHQEGPSLPEAEFILNPQQKSCQYPNSFLCAAGVSFKLIEALWSKLGLGRADELLDLFALGTLADMMPVEGENRTLLKKGLHYLRHSQKPGIKELLKHAKIETPDLRSQDVLFRIAPLLNSSGRMGSPMNALELLLATSPDNAAIKMKAIEETNLERRAIEDEVWKSALLAKENLEAQEGEQEVLVLADREWHQGVIGIVAAKLVEKFGVPTAVCAIDPDGSVKGSCRTPIGYNWHKALDLQKELLGKWGGHACAAGFNLSEDQLPELRRRLNQAALELDREAVEAEEVLTHSKLSIDKISEDTLTWLYRFEPFGHGNESPVFFDSKVSVGRECRVVGKKHLKLKLRKGRREFDCIAFGMGHLAEELKKKKNGLQIAYIPTWNYFRNQKSIQLQIMGINHEK